MTGRRRYKINSWQVSVILLVEYTPTNHKKKKVRERNGVSEALNQQVCSSLSTLLFIA